MIKLQIQRETLLEPLQRVMGVVEKKQTLPILSNVLLQAQDTTLSVTGTDLEVELIGRSTLHSATDVTPVTLPGRKLMEICRALPELADIELQQDKDKITVKSGRSRFTLMTLPAKDFPNIDEEDHQIRFNIDQNTLLSVFQRTYFAIAQQDVRYYLNGLLLHMRDGQLRAVATDGHRLALSDCPISISTEHQGQVIVPRKGILELMRILSNEDTQVEVIIGQNHIRVIGDDFTFTSKLIEGRFPDYERVIPRGGNKILLLERDVLKAALQRTSILCNEKFRGVRVELHPNQLTLLANNPEHEAAQEDIPINYDQETIDIGFNVTYLLDVLNTIRSDLIKLTFTDNNSSVLVESDDDTDDSSLYVIMPMRL